MTAPKEEDYSQPNDCGNGPKKRLEGGELTDDIEINDPETRKRMKPVNKTARPKDSNLSTSN